MTNLPPPASSSELKTTDKPGAELVTNCGHFLPRVGSATSGFEKKIAAEIEVSDKYLACEISNEDVDIASDESDCAVRTAREPAPPAPLRSGSDKISLRYLSDRSPCCSGRPQRASSAPAG